MAHNPEEYGRLRRQFIEAAAKYEPAGYQTSIQRTPRSEEDYIRRGRHDCVAYIKWPYKPWRQCTILAPNSGTSEKPFSTMKRLFSKAWLWLPRVIADGIVDAAEKHLSPPAELGLYWARSHHQLWGWLLWFDWLWRCGEVETEEPEVPPAGMDLRPFSYSADLIARWGLDGSAGTVPVWLAEFVTERKRAGPGPDAPQPSWDRSKGELSFDSEVIKRIRNIGVARNVVRVLDTFQELGWPDRVDSPLSSPNSQKHHATIRSLNTDLSRIRFRSDGEGEGFIWETL